MKRNRLSTRIVTAAAVLLAVGVLTSTVHAATESTLIAHHLDGSYNLAMVPSQASRCELFDRIYPGSAGAAKTLRNLATANPALITDVFFNCKADLFEGADDSCTAFKLSGCQCIQGCNQLFLP